MQQSAAPFIALTRLSLREGHPLPHAGEGKEGETRLLALSRVRERVG